MAVSTSDPLIGRLFDGRYKIVRKLGAGGMADVYLAEDQELGRRVALKLLNERHAVDESFVERFRREAKNAAGLSHPNIVAIYDRGNAEGTYYIAMEYLDGRSVKEQIVRDGPLPISLAIDYARQILAAVGFAHRHGIVHRDIKPHNVLLAGEERVKVTDFGIARSGASQMTEVGSIIGTAQYLSPEQARGEAVDQTSDLYSVGVVLYEMLTGVVPYTGETPLEIAMKHLSAVPEPPSRRRREVPRDLDLVVLRALAKEPRDRYRSAEEMDADLARVARGLAVSPQTQEAATQVLSGASTLHPVPGSVSGAVTAIAPAPTRRPAAAPPAYGPPSGYYGYTPPRRRPRVWPWLLAVALVIGAGVGGWYLYKKIQHELNANKPVAVGEYRGIRDFLAVRKVQGEGLRAVVARQATTLQPVGYVFGQSPAPGEKIDKGNSVTLLVSRGPPKVRVPRVVELSVGQASYAIGQAGLKVNEVDIHSGKASGTVTGQNPRAGSQVLRNSVVRINVSLGPKPVSIPSVIGSPEQSATAQLQALGFSIASEGRDSDQPKGTVLGTDPPAGTQAPQGSKVTLLVSRGPQTQSVPDVTSLDRATAIQTLRNSGFKVSVSLVETTDPAQDTIVQTQDPVGGTQLPPHSLVTIAVATYAGQATTAQTDTTFTDTTFTDTTATAPTETTATDTTITDTTATDTTAPNPSATPPPAPTPATPGPAGQ